MELTEQRTMPHSVEVSRNAKMEFSFVVKRYYADGEEAQAVEVIAKIYDLVLAAFKNG